MLQMGTTAWRFRGNSFPPCNTAQWIAQVLLAPATRVRRWHMSLARCFWQLLFLWWVFD